MMKFEIIVRILQGTAALAIIYIAYNIIKRIKEDKKNNN